MTFVTELERVPVAALLQRSLGADGRAVSQTLQRRSGLTDFAHLISPAARDLLPHLCRESQKVTRQRFGKVIRLFAPLYLSSECINNCKYCGFSRDNPIMRVTLSVEEVAAEAEALAAQGFRTVLLVAGEHPKFVSRHYIAECVRALAPRFASISLEVGPMATEEYLPLVDAGAEGLVVYQETYDRDVYQSVHTSGPKRDFAWRLETPERAYAAGFRRLGIGALFGLADWRHEAICLAAHADYLLRHCWKAQLTISLPRLRPCAGEFEPLSLMSDQDLIQLVCALRLTFPDVGLVLSTRESPQLRDALIPLGVTLISAGSHTEPGGYTGAGADRLHRTERGRILPLTPGSSEWAPAATGQFAIADERTPAEVAALIRKLGYEPVWKDWELRMTNVE